MTEGWQGLPITSHADRLLHRVAHLIRTSPYGLSEWCGGRVYVMADQVSPPPDGDLPMILVASAVSSWQLAVGNRAERTAAVLVQLLWEEWEHGQPIPPGRPTSAAVYDALCRTFTVQGGAALWSGDERFRGHQVENLETVYWNALGKEVESAEGETEIVTTYRLLAVEVTIGYHVDLDTGHPPDLDDDS